MKNQFWKYAQFWLGLVLCACLLVGSYLCSKSLIRYQTIARNIRSARTQLEQIRRIKKEVARQQRILARVRTFVEKAKAFGLVKDRWDRYGVEIQESITFPELRQILEQTVSKETYYFEPSSLYISKAKPESAKGEAVEPGKKKQVPSAGAAGKQKADLFLKLRGYFLVRRQ